MLLVAAAIMAVLCFGGAAIAFVAYDHATKIDRSTPGVSLQQYLDAVFDSRDTNRAGLFVCKNPQLGEVDRLFAFVQDREKVGNTKLYVSTADFDTVVNGKTATVNLEIKLSVGLGVVSQRDIEHWTFGLRKQSGWRVCTAHRVG